MADAKQTERGQEAAGALPQPADASAESGDHAALLNASPRAGQLKALAATIGRRPGGSAPIQRRATVAVEGLQRTNEVKPIYFAADSYANDRIYESALGQFDNQSAFTAAAANAAGNVGAADELDHATDNTAPNVPAADGAEKWITSPVGMEEDPPHEIEPFNLKVTATIGQTATSMTYHFGPFNHGYIMAQSHGNTHAAIGTDDAAYPGAEEDSVTFSNRHVATDEVAQTPLADRMTGGLGAQDQGAEERWDARTIVGGEGARFVPVLRLHTQGTLTNDSRFFCRTEAGEPAEDGDDVRWVTLRNLWGKWAAKFSSRFNIDAEWVADVIRTAQGGIIRGNGVYENMTVAVDYDLDRDQPR